MKYEIIKGGIRYRVIKEGKTFVMSSYNENNVVLTTQSYTPLTLLLEGIRLEFWKSKDLIEKTLENVFFDIELEDLI